MIVGFKLKILSPDLDIPYEKSVNSPGNSASL